MKNFIKSKINILILIIITLLVLYLSLKDDFSSTMRQILSINIYWLIMGIILVFSYWFLRSLVLHRFVNKFHDDYHFMKAFKLILVTQFFHAVTPFASGGQPYEIYALKKEGIKFSDVTNITIQNFIVYQIALVTLGIISIVANHFFHIFKEVGLLKDLVLIGFIVNLLVIVGLFIVSFGKKINSFVINQVINFLEHIKVIKNKEKVLNKWQRYINDFHSGAHSLIQNKKMFFGTILINFIALLCLYLVPMVILYSMGNYTSVNGFLSIISCAYIMLIGSFVPIPGGTGGLEYGFIAFFGNFVGGSSLKATMLIWRFLTYYFGMIIGAIALNIKGKE